MKRVKILSAFGLLAVASAANADVSSTWTFATDYNFRGISQNSKEPVLQGSLDYAHDSGAYAGLWLSTVNFDNNGVSKTNPNSQEYFHLERDVYAGLSEKLGSDLTLDLGGKYYTYNTNKLNYGEAYVSLAYKSLVKAKFSYSPNFMSGGNTAVSKPAYAASVDGAVPLPGNFSLLVQAGYNWGDYWDKTSREYMDYSAGFGYTLGKVDLSAKYVNTNTTMAKGNRVTVDNLNNAERAVLSMTTKFPW